uniref:NADH dehydrogenase subunit 4L n=1 Tax=Tomocerus caputiviolaceus TaxID=2763923 RepID=UPI0021D51C89|nr:NADH dehydrogenase subunit 4L [Tomocerus caputiviolaceus]UXC95412.1 NADH dehydrogenase subunit 4L [Tomocerus caputiviolaceus]
MKFCYLYLLFSGMWIFCSKREHFLSALLSLEFMVIGIFFFFFFCLWLTFSLYSLIYLTLTACEGALGLSILVLMSRTHGGDYFKNFNSLVN